MNNLYEKLRKSLEDKSSGYTGMIYRNVAENIGTYSERTDFKKYIFAGFNAFTPSEAIIVRHYLENGKAEIFFDLDTFYYDPKLPDTLPPYSRNISDLIHLTIKRLNLTERDIHFVGNHYRETSEKKITVTGISKGFHQVQYAVGLLKNINEEELNKTAVIFADESLIVPFLHSYDCTNTNVTMGYPIQGLPAYNLLQLAIQLVKNGTRMSDGETELKFYHKDILAFFRHPVISKNLFQTESSHEKFINAFISMNTIMVSAETIATLITNAENTNEEFQGKVIEFLKQVTAEGLAPLEALHFLFDQLAAENPQQNTLKHSIFRLIRDNLAEIGTLLRKFPATVGFTIETIELFINSRFSGLTLTQKGNRNQGLQVMGVLETRALDFDNIIMLSVNEGNLPVGKTQNSLIIYEVRKHFGLPTYHEKEAVSAYHFFRLLQRAKKIDLIYDNDTRDSLCEKSRFINQLRFENQRQNTGFKFTEKTISTQPSLKNNSQELSIQKNNGIIGLLRKMPYSPTKLSTYITCPLKFYLENIAGIKPPQNINEDIDSSVIGTVVHGILEKIFIELKNLAENKKAPPTETEIDTVFENTKKNLEENLKKEFQDALKDKNITSINLTRGKSFLTKTICQKYLEAYFPTFRKECSTIKDFINAEEKYEAKIKAGENDISLEGIIDRVEKRADGTIHILDYKTGKTEQKDIVNFNEDNLQKITKDNKFKQPLQLLTYAYLLTKKDNAAAAPPYHCGIVSIQGAAAGKECTYSFEVTAEMLDNFTKQLTTLLEEILNPETGFTQTEEKKHCSWCDYRDICGTGDTE